MVVDEAILNTPEYGAVRTFIRDHFYVKAVVSLGRQAFKYLAHTDAKTSVLFVTKKPEDRKVQAEPIFYSHAERVGYSSKGDWVGDDLPHVRVVFEQFRDVVLNNYQGAWFNADTALESIEGLPGFGVDFYAVLDGGGRARLDYFNAQYIQRVKELERRFGLRKLLVTI